MRIEYKIIEYTKNADGLTLLNVDGAKGWDVVFVISENALKYKLLLKRRIE